jgi:ankyrin repeat protein
MDPAQDRSREVLQHLYAGDRPAAVAAAGSAALDVFAAAALGDADQVAERLRADATGVTARTDDGFTALHLAAFFGTVEAVRVLLDAGADPCAVAGNAMMVTPLHSAVAHRDAHIVGALLEAGAPVNAKQAGGYTALHAAALHGRDDLVQLLLDHGADPELATDEGTRAADHAEAGGHDVLAANLRRRSAG